jgi:hypothetical protein
MVRRRTKAFKLDEFRGRAKPRLQLTCVDGRFDAMRGVPNKFYIARGFKSTFSVDCKPHFAGLWDTVSSVGWFLDLSGLKKNSMPYTAKLDQVDVVRHAVSLDERRAGNDTFRVDLPRFHSSRKDN